MKIVIDAAIPGAQALFSTLGDVTLLPGRDIGAAAVRDADILVVRTVTRVDGSLLEGSNVRFVASATSGTDHVDLNYLVRAGIGFADAAGCNARAVAEYVLSALCALVQQEGGDLRGRRAGIIGCGHVGSLVVNLLETCGVTCLVNDPPLARQRPDARIYHDLDTIREADIVSLHVPLILDGDYATLNLVDEHFLGGLREDAVLINTARGEVVDETALCTFLDAHPRAAAVLDVWRNEPHINTGLLKRVRLGTPHIAGYSLDGKLRATRMAYEEVCGFLGVPATGPALPRETEGGETVRLSGWKDDMEAVAMAVLGSYDVRSDSATLMRILEIQKDRRGDFFDALRNQYPMRREFTNLRVKLDHCSDGLGRRLRALGFQTQMAEDTNDA